VLPPYQKSSGSDWYTGTANAIYQNMHFINRYNPDYVVILSGDHIYKMDYSKMLEFHEEKEADCTIAVIDVSREEASRFGIMNTREDDSIYEFEEKPAEPKSTLASMGIYIFSADVLHRYLKDDDDDPISAKDFGKNIIPSMLDNGARLFAYRFDGYWKDVGTIDSLWEANMDLLDPAVPLELSDAGWKIYARNSVRPPQYVAPGANIQNSVVSEGADIYGTVDFSVLFPNVVIEPGAVVRDSIIMNGSVVKSGAVVEYSIVAENSVIGAYASIGRRPEDTPDKENWGVTVIASDLRIGDGVVIGAKQMIDADIDDAEKTDVPQNGEVG
jgi:glucose-1-phosphate adenylyltransferase